MSSKDEINIALKVLREHKEDYWCAYLAYPEPITQDVYDKTYYHLKAINHTINTLEFISQKGDS